MVAMLVALTIGCRQTGASFPEECGGLLSIADASSDVHEVYRLTRPSGAATEPGADSETTYLILTRDGTPSDELVVVSPLALPNRTGTRCLR